MGDSARLTPMQRNVWILSALGVALDGFDFFVVGVAMPQIQAEFQAAAWQVGLIGAAAVLGAVAGALGLGPITDRFGRKTIFLIDLSFFVIFSVLSALAWNVASLIFFRFMLGIGIGADYPISATYVAETMPSRIRGRMVASTIGFQAVGMLAGVLVGLVVLRLDPHEDAWRWMLGLGVLPALFILLMRARVPESPRWLASQGRLEEAASAAALLHGPEGIHRTDLTLEEQAGKPETLRSLFLPAMIRRTVLATVPWFLMDIATYGVGLFTPSILGALAFSSSADGPIGREIVAIEQAAFLDLFLLAGFGLAVLLIEKVGRIRLQLIGFAVMTVGLLLLAAVGHDSSRLGLVFAGFIFFNTFMNLGPNTTTYVLPAEIFPTRLRASGHGLAAAAGKLGAAVGIFFMPILNDAIGLTSTLILVAAACALGFLITWLCQVETTGKSLAELEGPAA